MREIRPTSAIVLYGHNSEAVTKGRPVPKGSTRSTGTATELPTATSVPAPKDAPKNVIHYRENTPKSSKELTNLGQSVDLRA